MDESLEVMVARTDDGARLPTRGSEYAAGWDLYALEEYVVPFRKSVKLRTGLRVAIPVGYEGQVRARSSLGSKGLILYPRKKVCSNTYGSPNLSVTITPMWS